MALSTCRECDGKVSTLAKTCPHCGVPNPATVVKKTTSKSLKKNNELYVHCPDKNCNSFSAINIIYHSTLGESSCLICGQKLISYDYKKGEPVIPRGHSMLQGKKHKTNLEDESLKPSKSSKEDDTSWEKFMEGKLDLKTAFWGYGFFGSIIVGVVCGFLAEAVGNFFILVYIISVVVLVIGLWQCASTYKKQMAQKKESEVWGVLTQVYCVVAALGLANFIKDFL